MKSTRLSTCSAPNAVPTARRATRLSSEIARGSAPSGGYVRRPGSPLRARQGVPGGPPPPSFVASPRAHGLRDRRARPFSRPVAWHRCGGGVGRHGVPGIPRSHQLGPCQSPSTRRLGGRHRPHHRLRRRQGIGWPPGHPAELSSTSSGTAGQGTRRNWQPALRRQGSSLPPAEGATTTSATFMPTRGWGCCDRSARLRPWSPRPKLSWRDGPSRRGLSTPVLMSQEGWAGSGGETRTLNLVVNSHPLCRLSYPGNFGQRYHGRRPAQAGRRAGPKDQEARSRTTTTRTRRSALRSELFEPSPPSNWPGSTIPGHGGGRGPQNWWTWLPAGHIRQELGQFFLPKLTDAPFSSSRSPVPRQRPPGRRQLPPPPGQGRPLT